MEILCSLTAAFAILVTVVVRAIDQKQKKLEQRVKALEGRPKQEKSDRVIKESNGGDVTVRYPRRSWVGMAK